MLSKKLDSFERAFDTLNDYYFQGKLERCVITIAPTPTAYGHYTPSKIWLKEDDKGSSYHEINLGAETLNRELVEVMATLLHEMVHHYCESNGIKDTSRGNVYHNKNFRDACVQHGLLCERSASHGWSTTSAARSLIKLCEEGAFEDVERDLHRRSPFMLASLGAGDEDEKPKPKRWHKYVCPTCGKWVRAREEMELKCMGCDEAMEEDDD